MRIINWLTTAGKYLTHDGNQNIGFNSINQMVAEAILARERETIGLEVGNQRFAMEAF